MLCSATSLCLAEKAGEKGKEVWGSSWGMIRRPIQYTPVHTVGGVKYEERQDVTQREFHKLPLPDVLT